MKIIYTFDNGETSEVEVSEEIGAVIIDSRREEDSRSRMERRHCYGLLHFHFTGCVKYALSFSFALFDLYPNIYYRAQKN